MKLLIAMARAKRGIQLRAFAERCGWSCRASYRDVETLRDAGVPIEHEHGWYRVPEGWIPAGTVDVTHDERLALFIARRLAPGLGPTVVGRALASLWSKLSTPNRQPTLPLGDEVSFQGPAAGVIDLGPHRITIDAAWAAVRERRALRIRYRKPGCEPSDRVIEPLQLYWSPEREALYLRAYCRERADFRLFAIHRISSIVLLAEQFARRPDPAWEAGHAFRLWCRATVERVAIQFSPVVADEIRECRWHATQHLSETADGGLVLEMTVAAPEELERWLLGFGPDVEVLAPASLADRIRRRHIEAAAGRAGTVRASQPPAGRVAAPKPATRAG